MVWSTATTSKGQRVANGQALVFRFQHSVKDCRAATHAKCKKDFVNFCGRATWVTTLLARPAQMACPLNPIATIQDWLVGQFTFL
jgi:hypothetical protein